MSDGKAISSFAEALLRNIPFAMASVAEHCTDPGSYARELARRVAKSVQHDIETVLAELMKPKELL